MKYWLRLISVVLALTIVIWLMMRWAYPPDVFEPYQNVSGGMTEEEVWRLFGRPSDLQIVECLAGDVSAPKGFKQSGCDPVLCERFRKRADAWDYERLGRTFSVSVKYDNDLRVDHKSFTATRLGRSELRFVSWEKTPR
jgi:hypothetical protein